MTIVTDPNRGEPCTLLTLACRYQLPMDEISRRYRAGLRGLALIRRFNEDLFEITAAMREAQYEGRTQRSRQRRRQADHRARQVARVKAGRYAWLTRPLVA